MTIFYQGSSSGLLFQIQEYNNQITYQKIRVPRIKNPRHLEADAGDML